MNFGMLRARLALLGICCAPLLVGVTACGDKKGGLVLSISTDMKAPKDVSVVSLTILTNNQVKYNFIGRVLPNGDVKLPATIAIAEPDDQGASIRIRAIAFQERKPRVLRDVRTSVPHGGRVALLRMPLNFIDDGSGLGNLTQDQLNQVPATGQLPPDPLADAGADAGGTTGGGDATGGIGAGELDPYSQFDSICGAGDELTQIDGECVDSTVDSNSLPDFDESLVGDGQDTASCFDLKKCLAGALMITGGADNGTGPMKDGGTDAPPTDSGAGNPDGSLPDAGKFKSDPSPMSGGFDQQRCLIDVQGRDVTKLNLALQTQGTGECLADGRCFVPLDHGDHGWREAGTVIQLAPGICKKINAGGVSLVEVDTGVCAPKEEKAPVCNLGEPISTGDGHDSGTGGDASGPKQQTKFLFGEDFVTDLVGTFNSVYFASRNRVALFQFGNTGQPSTPQNVTGITPGIHIYRFSPHQSGVVMIDGSRTGYIIDGAVAQTTNLGDTQGGALAVVGTTTNPIWSTDGSEQFGLWETVEGNFSTNFSYTDAVTMQPIPGNISALGSMGGDTFVIGTIDGKLRGCNDSAGGNMCGSASTIGKGARIEGYAGHMVALGPNMVDGYVLTDQGVFHGTGNVLNGTVSAPQIPGLGDTGPVLADGLSYPRAITAELGKCVFVSTANGVEWITPDNSSGIAATSPQNKPVLGVSIGRAGPLPVIVFSVFAPASQGGGVYSADVPAVCLQP